jgi:hypothetical protein
MIMIFFTENRLARLVYWPQGQKYNKEYLINEILEGINRDSMAAPEPGQQRH